MPKEIFAQACGGSAGDTCPAGWSCSGFDPGPPEAAGTCTAQKCYTAVCHAPDYCKGDVCVPASGGNQNPWTCFAAGTKVTMEGDAKINIEDVKVGDKVISQDESGNKSVSTVIKLDQPIREHMCRVDFVTERADDNPPLRMTNEHPVMTEEGWKSITPSKTAEENPELIVQSLGIGDKVVREDGSRGEVSDITCWSEKTPAYNLILGDGAHTYFADGYLAHNKGPTHVPRSCPGSQVESCDGPAKPTCVGSNDIPACYDSPYRDKFAADANGTIYGSLNCTTNQFACDINCGCCNVGSVWNCVAGATNLVRVTSADGFACPGLDEAVIVAPRTDKAPFYDSSFVWYLGGVQQTGSWVRYCRKQTCGCLSTCNAAAPAVPSLLTPADSAFTATNPTLDWSAVSSWGTKCPAPNVNKYHVYLWLFGAGVPATPTYIVDDAVTQKTVSGLTTDASYRWKIVASNGSTETSSAIRSFTVCTADAPNVPTLSSPANDVDIADTTPTLMWNSLGAASAWGKKCPGPNVNKFDVYVWEVGQGIGNAVMAVTVDDTIVQKVVSPALIPGRSYYWKIVATNGGTETSSATRRINILSNQIAGKVYYDATNSCAATPWNKGAGMTVEIASTGASSPVTNGTGAWTVTAAAGSNYSVALNNILAGYKCSTAAGCNTCSKTVASPTGNNNFYVTDDNVAEAGWWQTEGAGVYAGGNIQSILPSSSLNLILAPAGGTAAALFNPSGTANLGVGNVSTPGWVAKSRITREMKYQNFAKGLGLVASETGSWDVIGEITKEGYPDPTTNDYGYRNGSGTISNDMILVNEKYIIFVNGDLTINANITVPNSAFLAFIVKGNITIGAGVTNLQGLYLADGNFVTLSQSPANDIPLNVEGTVVAWGLVDLNRNLGGLANFTTPAEKFTYRPDFLTNMPHKMKTFAMEWQEVVPGTYGN